MSEKEPKDGELSFSDYKKLMEVAGIIDNQTATPEQVQEAIDILRRERTRIIARAIHNNLLG